MLRVHNAVLLEPATGERTEGAWLEADGGRITATGTGKPPAGEATTLDAAGATVLPGLIDAHVHLLATTLDLAAIGSWTPGYATVRALAEAGRMLRRGFTTVRDVGGADHGMAQALEEGLAEGPRLVYGGRALSQTGGHGDLRDKGDDCCAGVPGIARVVDGADRVREAARDEFRKGAAHLKVMVSGGVASPSDEISAVQYGEQELRAAVEEAENHNRYVTVHAYHPRAINRALRAGVRCVEHGNLLDGETTELLLANSAYLVPTLVTYDQMRRYGRHAGLPETSYRKIAEVADAGLAALERAHRAGVQLVYGSDLLGPLQTAQLEEFPLRAQVQPPLDVLRAATTNAARLLGREGELGTLAAGAQADLLVLDGDPLEDIGVLTEPWRRLRWVVRGGAPTAVADR